MVQLAVRGDRSARAHPLDLIDPTLIGGPIDDLLRVSLDAHDDFSPHRLFGSSDLAAAKRHRILPLIRESWVEPSERNGLRADQRAIALLQLELLAVLHAVVDVLTEGDIEHRVLKGLATGQLDYPNAGLRHTGDVDVLVRPADLMRAADLVSQLGTKLHPGGPSVAPDLVSGVTLVTERQIEIDLHSRLVRYFSNDADLLMASPVQIGGGPAAALSEELRLVHAAGHLLWTTPGSRRLSSLVDISVLLDRGVDVGVAREKAESLGVGALVAAALDIEHRLRGRDVAYLEAWPFPGPLERRAFLSDERSLMSEHLLGLMDAQGFRSKLLYVRQFGIPNRRFVESRGGYRRHYGRLVPGRKSRA